MLKLLISYKMHNKVKIEHHFAIPSDKRVAIFQKSLIIVREEATAQLSNNKINI